MRPSGRRAAIPSKTKNATVMLAERDSGCRQTLCARILMSYMPLVHQSRRLRIERAKDNRFVSDACLSDHLENLWQAYLNTSSGISANLLIGEIDLIEMLIAPS
jgi:hypothetical protein